MNLRIVLTFSMFEFKKTSFLIFCFLFLASHAHAHPGRLDLVFLQALAAGADVSAIEIQPDGKIVAAGRFTTIGPVSRKDVVRLNTDGSIDPSFNAGSGANNGDIFVMKLQADGKILIGGSFNNINGVFIRALARLNTDGSLDTSFEISGIDVTFTFDIDIQTDGKILISASNLMGSFFVTRLSANGLNESGHGVPLFRPGGSGFRISAGQAKNRILVGGLFSYAVNGTTFENLARINSNGSIDPTFTANITNSSTFDIRVNVRSLAGGKILIFGKFNTVNRVTRRNLAILNSDGSLDATFNPATSGPETILTAAVQTDGKIIIGGRDFMFNNPLRGNIARLNSDGSVDRTFNQGRGANGTVKTVKIRNNNKILIGGAFFRYHVYPRAGLAQINL